MRALILDADGRLRLDANHPEPQPGPDEVLVHVSTAGVCATDLELVRGYAGFCGVLGHEFVGVVDSSDAELGGRRVVADINIGCGECSVCRAPGAGHRPPTHAHHHCQRRTTLGIRRRPGVFAERVAIPRRNLVEVPATVPDELAVFTEPLAAALHVLDERPSPSESPDSPESPEFDASDPILVLGDGKLGLLIALALAAAGAPVELIGRHPHKLEIAARAGIPTRLGSPVAGPATPGATPRASVVVDATGSSTGLAEALALVAARGTVVVKTTTASPTTLDLARLVVDELRIVGSRCGDMRRAIELLASGRVDPRPLLAARYPLADAVVALEHAARPGMLKVLVDVPG